MTDLYQTFADTDESAATLYVELRDALRRADTPLWDEERQLLNFLSLRSKAGFTREEFDGLRAAIHHDLPGFSDDIISGRAKLGRDHTAAEVAAMHAKPLAWEVLFKGRFNALRPRSTSPAPEPIACPNCGSPTYQSQLMHASRGTACPECYDAMSD